jgi:hypothetical protein
VSFLKTDFYVQIMGTGDFTQINIQAGDEGGELVRIFPPARNLSSEHTAHAGSSWR